MKEAEHEREEVVYGITNLPRKKANALRLLALQQEHWRIENRLHYRRDVTLDEDACQVRVVGAPQALAALNGGVLALSGLVAGAECGVADAPFLCLSAQRLTITVWHVAPLERVNQKALAKELQLYAGIWYDAHDNSYMVGSAQAMKLEQPRAHLIRHFDIYVGAGHFTIEPLLLATSVQFVRLNQYTVYPYAFHLIDMYVENVLRFQ